MSRRREPFARNPIERLVECAYQTVEKLLDLHRVNNERRRQRQYVACDRTYDQPLILGETHHASADAVLRIKRTLARLISDKFHAADQPKSARVSHHRMPIERRQPCLEQRS